MVCCVGWWWGLVLVVISGGIVWNWWLGGLVGFVVFVLDWCGLGVIVVLLVLLDWDGEWWSLVCFVWCVVWFECWINWFVGSCISLFYRFGLVIVNLNLCCVVIYFVFRLDCSLYRFVLVFWGSDRGWFIWYWVVWLVYCGNLLVYDCVVCWKSVGVVGCLLD